MLTTSSTALIANASNGALLELLREGTMAYLVISFLAPLSWMLAVEICRRARPALRRAAGERRPEGTTAIVGVQIAGFHQQAPRQWGMESNCEQS